MGQGLKPAVILSENKQQMNPPNILTPQGRPLLHIHPRTVRAWLTAAGLAVFMLMICALYAFANPHPQTCYDYQFRIARALLSGKLGLDEPYSWLNELVPFEGKYYSVFPFGTVLCMVPVALLQQMRGSDEFPGREVVAWLAGMTTLFVLMLSRRYKDPHARVALLVIFVMLGTWTWCNVIFASAWQIALAFAMLGQFGALAFTLIEKRPFLAGLFFAIGFGSRTEILLAAPLYLYLLVRDDPFRDKAEVAKQPFTKKLRREWPTMVWFCLCPFVLGCATLWYNYARFHHVSDFGYDHLECLTTEEWYKYGFFSLYAVPINLQTMLLSSSWEPVSHWPFFKPNGGGGSIISASPFLLLLLRRGGRDKALRVACWTDILVLTTILWLHGNNGGVQFSYRYATVLLPYMFVLLLDQRGGRVTWREITLLVLSVAINTWAIYLNFWTQGGA